MKNVSCCAILFLPTVATVETRKGGRNMLNTSDIYNAVFEKLDLSDLSNDAKKAIAIAIVSAIELYDSQCRASK